MYDGTSTRYAKGAAASARIYDEALSEAELQAIYDGEDSNGVIDMRTVGSVNNSGFDNTAALIWALDRRENGERLELFFAAGDWHFYGPLPVSSYHDLSIFDNISMKGVPSAATCQHQEQDGEGDKQRTRFILHLDADGDTWWDHQRGYRFGPIAVEDITFVVDTVGNVFSFGTLTDVASGTGTLRGLRLTRCIGSYRHIFGGNWTDAPNAQWINDTSLSINGSSADGYVLNRSNNSFFVRLHKCYDVEMEQCTARGFRNAFVFSNCDCMSISRLRSLLCGKLIDCLDLMSGSVPSHADDLYAEDSMLVGAVLKDFQVGRLRSEFGYNGVHANFLGKYSLPSSVEWDVAAGGPTINFTFRAFGPGETVYNCHDYFEPRTVIRLNPDEAGEPDRYFYITKVNNTTLEFIGHTGQNYVPRVISGNGASCTRFFGTGAILHGKCSLLDPSVSGNEILTDFPSMFLIPNSRKPLKVGTTVDGQGKNASDPTSYPMVLAAGCGLQDDVQGGVDWFGSSEVPNHPLVNVGGIGPKWDDNVREPLYDPFTRTQLFKPGRGVSVANNNARDLQFHYIDGVPCVRLGDSAIGWDMMPIRLAGFTLNYEIRLFATGASTDPASELKVAGYTGADASHAFAAGWRNIVGSRTGGTTFTGNILRLRRNSGYTSLHLYVAWVKIVQVDPVFP